MRRLEKWNKELDNDEPYAAEDSYMLDNLQAKLDNRWRALEDLKNSRSNS
jgi:hypothetical protein